MQELRYAILIGNSHYPVDEHFTDLRAADRDVDSLADVLSDPNVGPFDEVVRLKGAAHHDILDAIFQVLDLARKDDLVLIYFSGHGKCDDQGRLHIAALNTQSDLMGVTAVPLDTLKDAIDDCHSTRIVLILDCLFRGADGGLLDANRLDAPMRQFSSGRGKYIMMSPCALAFLQEKQKGAVSGLTKQLVEGLRTGRADIEGTGMTRVEDWYQYAYGKLTAEYQQEPLKWDLNRKGDLILVQRQAPPAKVPAAAMSALPRATPAAVKARYDAIVQLFKKGEVIPFLGPELVHSNRSYPPIHDELAQKLADSVGLSTDMEPLTLISQKIDMVVGRGGCLQQLAHALSAGALHLSPRSHASVFSPCGGALAAGLHGLRYTVGRSLRRSGQALCHGDAYSPCRPGYRPRQGGGGILRPQGRGGEMLVGGVGRRSQAVVGDL